MKTLALLIACFVFASCTTVGQGGRAATGGIGSADTFYAASQPTPVSAHAKRSAAVADAERKALDFGQPNVAYPWVVKGVAAGTVTASEPFRVARRDCRRLDYALTGTTGPGSRSQVTVCRSAGDASAAAWEPVV